MSYQHMIEQFGVIPANHKSPVTFPVSLQDVHLENGEPIPGYKGVYREDTGKVLAIHSDAYNLVPHEDVFAAFDEAIDQSGLDTEGLRIFDDMSHQGSRAFRQYLFPKHVIDLGGNDVSALRIIAVNSYDGSSGAIFRAGAYRFVCANMAIIGLDAVKISVRHTKSFNLDQLAANVANTSEAFARAGRDWPVWQQRQVNEDAMLKVFEAVPNASKPVVEHLTHAFVTETAVKGEPKTVWTLYNVLTQWATHTQSKSNNAAYRLEREQKVAKVLESRPWKELVAA